MISNKIMEKVNNWPFPYFFSSEC